MFEDFHSRRKQDVHPEPQTTQLPVQGWSVPAAIPMQAFMGTNPLLSAIAMMAGLSSTNAIIPPALPVQPIVQPQDITIQCTYPEIEVFFQQLMVDNPRRNFMDLSKKLTDVDFFCIDEIADEPESFFKGEPYGLSVGNAKFVVKSIKEAVERVKEEARK